MKLIMSNECRNKIDNLLRSITVLSLHPKHTGLCSQVPPDYGVAVFAEDAGPDTLAEMYPIPVATNIRIAKALLSRWGDKEVGTVTAMVHEFAQPSKDVLQNIEDTSDMLGCWVVAWLHMQGISLQKQVQLSDLYTHLFSIRGKQFTHSRTFIGPRISEVLS